MAEFVPSYSAQHIERLLECGICLERYISPKLLQCQHTFCKKCMQALVDTRRNCLQCPSCRRMHRLPLGGVDGFPNNLTITALLDLPKEQPHPQGYLEHPVSQPNTRQSKGEDQCNDCKTVSKLCRCFHCEQDICKSCSDSHKHALQQEILADMQLIKEKMRNLSSSLQMIKKGSEEVIRARDITKHKIWDEIQIFCMEAREKGNIATNHLDQIVGEKIRNLHRKQEKLEVYSDRLESFYNFTMTKLKEPNVNMSDTELMDIVKQSEKYLDKVYSIPSVSNKTVNLKRRGSNPSKAKRQSRSSSTGRSSTATKTAMIRQQSTPDIISGSERQGDSLSPSAVGQTAGITENNPKFYIEEEVEMVPKESDNGHSPDKIESFVAPSSPQRTISPAHMDTSGIEMSQSPNTVSEFIPPSTRLLLPAAGSELSNVTTLTTHVMSENSSLAGLMVKAVIGKRGSRFWNPSDVCISPMNGTIIAVDCYKNCVQILDRDGHFVTRFGSVGSEDGRFDYPIACACTREGYIMIADSFNHRIQVFDRLGIFLGKFGHLGTDPGSLESPSGIAIDRNGYIYIADTNNDRIQVYDPQGIYIHSFGTPDTLQSSMPSPRYSSMTISPNGDLFVSDSKNHCVHVFACSGLFLHSIGRQGPGIGEFSSPRGLVLDQNGHILITDRDNHRVQVFQQDGTFLYAFGSQGERAGQFQGPEGIALADNGDIIVAECGGQRIQIFTQTLPM